MKKIIFCFFLFSHLGYLFSCNVKQLEKTLNIIAEQYKNDTVIFEITNLTNDSLYFSVFLELSLNEDQEIFTDNYDIFCNRGNPSEQIIRILPQGKLSFKNKVNITLFRDNDKIWNHKCRLLLKVRKYINGKVEDMIYSNWIWVVFQN